MKKSCKLCRYLYDFTYFEGYPQYCTVFEKEKDLPARPTYNAADDKDGELSILDPDNFYCSLFKPLRKKDLL